MKSVARRLMPLLVVLMSVVWMPMAFGGNEESAVIEVEGMTCGSCAAGLQSLLGKTTGVVDARVSYEDGKAVVRFDDGEVAIDDLVKAIEAVGYQARFLPGEEATTLQAAGSGSSCNDTASVDVNQLGGSLTEAELARVVDFVVERLVGASDHEGPISREIITEKTGVTVPDTELGRVQGAVIARMQAEHPDVLAQLEPGRCAEFGACSLQRNLAGATGELLEMYEREKAQDGKLYDDFPLPEFEARDLQNKVVHSADLRGQRTLLVLLAGHCNHCHDSLPILQEVQDTWSDRGVRLVAVVVNSGTVESVNSWISHVEPRHEVWVYEDDSLGELVDSHLVPTYLFIDADGQVVEKLVGFKEKDQVLKKVASFVERPQPLDIRKIAAGTR